LTKSEFKTGKNIIDHQQKECLRCGRCCLADFTAYVTEDDIRRWKAENREDILNILENEQGLWQGDHLVNAHRGTPLRGCPFFFFDSERFGCAIHETRPAICRNYEPGSSELCPQYEKGNVS
jgi:Fe-S-cluster containining protein